MMHVGLTGNVAAGKSTVARWFEQWGATLIDSDLLVREVQAPGSAVLDEIVSAFGPDSLAEDGTLDRATLRRRVMADPKARETLNGIVHPAVQARRDVLLSEARTRGDGIVVSDIPLLFEATDPDAFDAIVLVDSATDTRRTRLMEFRGLDAADANRLIEAQWPTDRKRDRSDFVIDNDGSLEELGRAARRVWDTLEAHSAGA